MRDAVAHSRGVRIAGYDVVRIVLGLLLLSAAALKGHQLATEPVAVTGLLDSRWFLIGVVEFELFFGLWLLSGLYPKWTRAATLSCFVLFAGVSLWKALSGEATCGCFGRVPVNPWYTFVLDTAAVAALLCWRPNGEVSRRLCARVPIGVTTVTAIWLLAGVPAAVAMGSYQAATISETGDIFGDSEFVVLEPETWVGKRFPLLKYIDIGDQLAEGRWIVLLYHHDCPSCQEEIANYHTIARRKTGDSSFPPVGLIEVPPYGSPPNRVVSSDVRCMSGRLDNTREWFVTTPAVISIREGVVSGVFAEGESPGLADARASR